jgi:cysteine-rich repeat protein
LKITPNPTYNKDLSDKGCSADCKTVMPGYFCPTDKVGPCSATCGNKIYEGKFPDIGRTKSQSDPEEFCDDGNNVNGDGCSNMCELEDPTKALKGTTWTCKHIFLDLKYELPRFYTTCAKTRRLRRLGIPSEDTVYYMSNGTYTSNETEDEDFSLEEEELKKSGLFLSSNNQILTEYKRNETGSILRLYDT